MPARSFLRYLKPFSTEQFGSRLPPAEVLRRVQASLAPPPGSQAAAVAGDHAKPFKGTVGLAAFELRRVIDYRNDMLPLISGTVASAGRGSAVQLRHQLHPLVLVFGALWLLIVGGVAASIAQLWWSSGKFDQNYLIPFGMFFFGVILLLVPFWLEVRKSRALLQQLLELEAPPAA